MTYSKIIAIILATIMLFSLCACDIAIDTNDGESDTKEEMINEEKSNYKQDLNTNDEDVNLGDDEVVEDVEEIMEEEETGDQSESIHDDILLKLYTDWLDVGGHNMYAFDIVIDGENLSLYMRCDIMPNAKELCWDLPYESSYDATHGTTMIHSVDVDWEADLNADYVDIFLTERDGVISNATMEIGDDWGSSMEFELFESSSIREWNENQ